MHKIYNPAGLKRALMVASGDTAMLPLPALSPHLFILLTHHFSYDHPFTPLLLFFFSYWSGPLNCFLPLPLSPFVRRPPPSSITLTNIDRWRQVGVEVCVSNRGVCSCHSLQQSASIDFFGAYLIHSLHISPSLSLSLNNNNIHGWLAARVNWEKKN